MPPTRQNVPPELVELERKKRKVTSDKAIERSKELIRGARALIERARLNNETSRELREEKRREENKDPDSLHIPCGRLASRDVGGALLVLRHVIAR